MNPIGNAKQILAIMVAVFTFTTVGFSMSASAQTISVQCTVHKSAAPELCDLFYQRMVKAYGAAVRENVGAGISAQLEVLHWAPRKIKARINWTVNGSTIQGDSLSAMVMDGALAKSNIIRFLDGLISATPRS